MYSSTASDDEKRRRKAEIIAARAEEYQGRGLASSRAGYKDFHMGKINNAYIDLYRLYEGESPLYRDFYEKLCGSDMRRFIQTVARIANGQGRPQGRDAPPTRGHAERRAMTAILSLLSALLYGSGRLLRRPRDEEELRLLGHAPLPGRRASSSPSSSRPLVGPNAPTAGRLRLGLPRRAHGLRRARGPLSRPRRCTGPRSCRPYRPSSAPSSPPPSAPSSASGPRPRPSSARSSAFPPSSSSPTRRARARDSAELRASFLYGLVAGLGFGCFFIAISRTSPGSGLWPLLASRAASMAATAAFVLAGGSGSRVARPDRPTALFAGVADMGANVCFLLASRSGLLILVTLIDAPSSPRPPCCSPRIFQGQRISGPRAAGIALALAGVALIGLR